MRSIAKIPPLQRREPDAYPHSRGSPRSRAMNCRRLSASMPVFATRLECDEHLIVSR